MPDLKLGKLPDRSPIKVSISIMPDLAADLSAYAELYKEAYDREEPLATLIPAMLTTFLASDRAFVRARPVRK